MILPALTEATSPFFRPIKYSLFPPLGLATLAGYLDPRRRGRPAGRARRDAAPGRRARPRRHPGLHHLGPPRLRAAPTTTGAAARTSCSAGCTSPRCPRRPRSTPTPSSSARARTPGRRSCGDFRAGRPRPLYRSTRAHARPACRRSAATSSSATCYLVPNSIVVSRGCPHVCDFCYKEAFFAGGRVVLHADGRRRAGRDRAPARPPPLLPRRPPVRQPALRRGAVRRHARHGPAVAGRGHGAGRARARPAREGGGRGLRSLFVGFETLDARQPARAAQVPEPATATTAPPSAACTTSASWSTAASSSAWTTTTRACSTRTVEWAVEPGHRDRDLPHPDALSRHARSTQRMEAQGRILHRDWDLYDTRHVVFRPARLTRGRARGGLLARLPRLLPLGLDLARRGQQADAARARAIDRADGQGPRRDDTRRPGVPDDRARADECPGASVRHRGVKATPTS